METDGLPSVRTETLLGNEKNSEVQRCQIMSRWALVVAVTFFAVAPIVDIREARSTRVQPQTHIMKWHLHHCQRHLRHQDMKPLNSQFISFTISTSDGLAAEYGECEGKSIDPNPNSNLCYLGSDTIESEMPNTGARNL